MLKRLDRALGAAKLLGNLLYGHIGHKAQTDDLALLVRKIVKHLVQLFMVELCVDCAVGTVARPAPGFQWHVLAIAPPSHGVYCSVVRDSVEPRRDRPAAVLVALDSFQHA